MRVCVCVCVCVMIAGLCNCLDVPVCGRPLSGEYGCGFVCLRLCAYVFVSIFVAVYVCVYVLCICGCT